MKLTIAQKQIIIFVGLISLTIVASLASYRLTQQKWLLFREGENRFYRKDFNGAISFYLRSLEQGKTSTKLLVHLADSYTTNGNFPEAIKYYKKYLQAVPEDRPVRFHYAQVLNWNGNFQESKEEYQKLLVNPNEG